jgi:hypothetical protein
LFKALWDRLCHLEKQALVDADTALLLKKLLWPRSTFCREMLVGAYECDFEKFPADLIEELEEASICQATSVLCENAHKTINAAANHCPNGVISRQQKWHALLASPLLEEQELAYSEPNEMHRVEAIGKVINPKEMFESDKQPFSLGDDKLADVMENHKKLQFPGPTGYFHIGAGTSALIKTGQDHKAFKMNWLALLGQPGTLLYNNAAGGDP